MQCDSDLEGPSTSIVVEKRLWNCSVCASVVGLHLFAFICIYLHLFAFICIAFFVISICIPPPPPTKGLVQRHLLFGGLERSPFAGRSSFFGPPETPIGLNTPLARSRGFPLTPSVQPSSLRLCGAMGVSRTVGLGGRVWDAGG